MMHLQQIIHPILICFLFSKGKAHSLHMADDTIVITPDHLHVDQVSEIVGAPSAGAISLFVGGPSFLYLVTRSP